MSTTFTNFAKAYRSGRKALKFTHDDYADPAGQKPNHELQKHGVNLYKHLVRKMGPPIGYGRHRITFANKHFVVKLPRSIAGISANHDEVDLYKRDKGERHHLAPSKLVKTKSGIDLLVMPKLDVERFDKETNAMGMGVRAKVPRSQKWIWNYDGGQVGYDRKGKLKAFDYAG